VIYLDSEGSNNFDVIKEQSQFDFSPLDMVFF